MEELIKFDIRRRQMPLSSKAGDRVGESARNQP